MTDHELQERLEAFEKDLMSKVGEISNHKRSWLYNNVGSIVTATALLIAIAVAWGATQTELGHMRATQEAFMTRLEILDARVRAHHENTDVHVDREWKSYVTRQLEDIRSLIVKHMARDIR